MPFPILGDGSNAGTNPFGLTFAGMGELNEKIIGGFINEVWYQDTLTDRITKAGIPEFKNGGWVAKFRIPPRATVRDYVMGKDLVYDNLGGWTTKEIELDRAAYGTYTMNDLQRAIQNREVTTIEQVLSHMGKSLGDEMAQKQWNAVMGYLQAFVTAKAVMAAPTAQAGLFHKGAAKTLPTTGKWDVDPAAFVNVMAPFRAARIDKKRRNVPKTAKIYALVSPEVMDIAAHMEKVHYTVGSSPDADRITRGADGEMIISGFEVIETPWIEAATVGGQSGQHAIYFGCKDGFAFHRVLDKSDQIRPEKDFADAYRQLSAYGMAIVEDRLFGVDYLKIS